MTPNFLTQDTGDVEIKNEINDEMYSQSLNIDSQMNEFVDNSIKNSTPFYNSSSLHNIVTNIQAIQYKICNIEKDYEKLLEEKNERSKRKGRSWTIDSNRDDAKLVGKIQRNIYMAIIQ